MSLHPDLIAILVCPACKNTLQSAERELFCGPCAKAYPVLAGIPRLTVDEAVPFEPATLSVRDHAIAG